MKFIAKTIEYGLYLLAFMLPVQTRWIIKAGEINSGYWEYGTYAVYGTDILLIFALLLFVIYKFLIFNFQFLNKSQIPNKSKIRSYFIGGLLLMSAISVFFAPDKSLALYKLGWLIMGIGLFWLITGADYSRIKLIYALLAGIFLQAGLGIWQFFSQSTFANKWLGLALHNPADLGTSVIEALGADGIGERWLRAYGGLDHPNILGGLLAVGVLLLIGEIIKHNKFLISNFQFLIKSQIPNPKSQNIFKIINWGLLAILSAALFFSFSRSAWLALAVGLAVMVISAVANRNLKAQKSLAKIILIMGILFFILFGLYQNLPTARLSGQGRLENKSTEERLASYGEAWKLIKNNWLFGVGLGNYTLAVRDEISSGESGYYYQPAHNVFLLIWSEIGIAGLLFFSGLIVYSLILNLKFKILNYGDGKIQNNMMVNQSILIALIILFCLDHWLWSLHFGALFFWLALGLTRRNCG